MKTGAVLDDVRSVLELDRSGRPRCPDSRVMLQAIARVGRLLGPDAFDTIVRRGFLARGEERHAEHLAPMLVDLAPARFAMGTEEEDRRHFCGEVPRHMVELSGYALARTPVTNVMYSLIDHRRDDLSSQDRRKPVVDVTWFDATLFAIWLGSRLPTEAEWEFACGAGADAEWCCEERHLTEFAWYGDNSAAELHEVGCLTANAAGLFDMHGNVSEWCSDDYDANFYARPPRRDPLCHCGVVDPMPHKALRGGSVHALAEMCRTRYRYHEPPEMGAGDIGFRLAGPRDDA
jgi:formylglycine-generating enzyme